ncbi:LysM peptidoglycan-binding domain-containing protein [Halobacillus litoralis]|uniref:LysM peptidoglycan-binding and 3D domain-containing protein n=1 Tax=Halobacillus litoralis TaxID=45668 RepID=UPI001CD30E65|nr:3D domain-containing protein [Halobacillus litoralis]MCA0972531.1 LysM peptidoglycan-binding domain-containing protein [Halobacillus litoralis]
MKKTILSLAAVTSIMATTTIAASAEEISVNKGDTLWGIAQNNGVSVADIKQENNLTSNLIYPDQILKINENNGATVTAASSADAEKVNAGTYTVKSGDTLYAIATQHGMSVANLKAANGLTSNLIHPGQELSLNGEVKATTQSTSEAQSTSSSQVEGRTLNVEATAYTAYCEGCSGVTYTGIDLRANPNQKVIAVDPDVIPLGSEVYVEGYGRAVAGDIGGAIQGNRIDVFIPNQSNALDFGRKNVEVTILNEG